MPAEMLHKWSDNSR